MIWRLVGPNQYMIAKKVILFNFQEESLGKKNDDILNEVLKVEAFAKDLVKVSKQTFGFIPNGLDPQ